MQVVSRILNEFLLYAQPLIIIKRTTNCEVRFREKGRVLSTVRIIFVSRLITKRLCQLTSQQGNEEMKNEACALTWNKRRKN